MPDLPPDDLGPAREEESLFARDYDGRLIRIDTPTLADLGKTVQVRIDGSEWFTVPKAVPATDSQGNILRNPDDSPVVRATTIYDASRSEAALAAGLVAPPWCPVRIPVLCHRDHLNPVAVCRVCAVQILGPDKRDPNKKREERKLLPACQHRVADKMEAHTLWSPEAKYRKAVRESVQVLYELLAADHHHPDEDAAHRDRGRKYHNELANPVSGADFLRRGPSADLGAVLRANWEAYADDAQTAREQADRDRILAGGTRFAPRPYRPELVDGWADALPDHVSAELPRLGQKGLALLVETPPFLVDHNNCILCDRCIRACSDVKPFKVIGRSGKGGATRIAFDLADVPMAQSSCRSCGECMTACPTGAITFQYRVVDASPDRLADVLTGHGHLAPATVVEADELLAHPLFARLSKAFLEWNRGAVRRREVRPGDVIAEEGEFGSTAFVLLPGEEGATGGLVAVCRQGAKSPRELPYAGEPDVDAVLARVPADFGQPIWVHDPDPGDVIGEMSPLSHARRNASLVVVRAGAVLEIDRQVLHVLVRDPVNRMALDNRYTLRAVAEFLPQGVRRSALFAAVAEDGWVRRFVRHLSRAVVTRTADRSWWDAVLSSRSSNSGFSLFSLEAHPTATHRPIPTAAPPALRGNVVELVRASPGQLICRAGEPADNFYLIRRGFVGVEVEGPAGPVVRPPLKAGDCFGEVAVLTALWDDVETVVGRPVKRGVRTATCTALDHTELVMVPKTVFESFLNDKANGALRAGLQARCAEILTRDIK